MSSVKFSSVIVGHSVLHVFFRPTVSPIIKAKNTMIKLIFYNCIINLYFILIFYNCNFEIKTPFFEFESMFSEIERS